MRNDPFGMRMDGFFGVRIQEPQRVALMSMGPAPTGHACAHCKLSIYDGENVTLLKHAMFHSACVDAHKRALIGLVHDCPQCRTRGTVDDHQRPIKGLEFDEEATAQGGWFAPPVYREYVKGYEQERCPCCAGVGYLDHEPKPITKTEIVGWK